MTLGIKLNYQFCARTDQGRVRSNNEDAVIADASAQLAVLADGMGGYNAGEIASGMATSLIHDEMTQWLAQAGPRAASTEVRRALEDCVERTNHAIFDASLSHPQYSGMGTTVVVGVFLGDRLILGHIGDSRCYCLRGGVLRQITRDHSWLQEQVDAGILTPQEAAISGQRNLVTRALGVESAVLVEINEFPVEPQDLFVMCSDGLTDMVEDDQIQTLAMVQEPLEDKAAHLIEAANARGGRDNISVLLVQAGSIERKRGLMSRFLRAD
ncbi:Stp1/IreP family PP2C-type Ser/Thr phosphatase [Acidovorax sp. SUPP2522]|uniref:Stp1/IreP family PP2C-type Ser/Thr phosphatase n=1 Tax=unclassified Acidovorax TaxID=2684926 RepID=UPI00234A22CA|nr:MULTISPECIES: Stp1/IreP family PP2C-type Ser/Thr phosphatase [unclassified Acidovorax]WCM98014.1 Stp1/IreP family PP2C-type Ser/Thr phosphatase [Acidovorax sp. GBBC 1281]GKT17463.1 Stp1/IreP family PP2C-type Ser/Thr phosphatase [Acidovorax sp. SUPP2522]